MLTFKFDKKFIYLLTISLIISLLYIYPFTILDRYQVDDLGRSIFGYTKWSSNGRPLADYLYIAFNAGYPILDLSPLTQIIAVLSLCLSMTAYIWQYCEDDRKIQDAIAIFIFIGNPFFLENLSFKFDVLGMALSASFLIAIFTIKRSLIGAILSIILILCSLSLYQAAIGLYAIFFIIDNVLIFNRKNEDKRNFVHRIIYYGLTLLIGYSIYHIAIKELFVNDDYSMSHASIISMTNDGLIQFKYNIKEFLRMIMDYVNSAPWPFVALYVLTTTSCIIKIMINKTKNVNNKDYIILSMILFSPLLTFFFSFAHLAMLKQPIFSPRVMVSFGGFLFFLALLCNIVSNNRWLSLLITLPIAGFSFVHSYAIANAAKSQDRLDSLILSSVSSDINHSQLSFETVSIHGTMPSSDQRTLVIDRFPLSGRVIPIFLNTNDFWGVMKLRHYSIKLEYSLINESDIQIMCHSTPIAKTKNYSIFANGKKAIISFEKPGCDL